MSNQADVIVVGAGPAGSTSAAVLARYGFKVLLIDREQFPRDKACGDVVPLRCFLDLNKIGLLTFDFDRFDISHISLQGSQNIKRTFRLAEQQGLSTCVVSRTSFDQVLHQHALSCGAKFRQCNVKGPLIDRQQVIGVTGTVRNQEVQYHSRIVIAADGATSSIARGLSSHLRRDDLWAVALRGYVHSDVDLERTIELAFLDHIQPGYAWFFPTETRRANVGIGMRSDFYKRQNHSLNHLLSEYLAGPEIAMRIGRNTVENIQSWPIPFFSFEKQRVFDGALLAGDAGGFVHPITSAGIYPAIVSGICAAEAAIHALEIGDISQVGLSHYDTLWHGALAADFKPAVTANKLATMFPHLVSAALLLSQPTVASQQGTETPLPFSLGKF